MESQEFQEWRDELQNNLVELTIAAKCIQSSEIPFLRSNSDVSRQLDLLSDSLLTTINRTLEYSSFQDNVQIFEGIEDVEDHFEIAVDCTDNLFEKANVYLDSTRQSKQKLQINPELASTKGNQKHIMRPQLRFKDDIDNSNTPWKPIITHKPNALKPLKGDVSMSPELKNHVKNMSKANISDHPYEFEIQNIEYPLFLFEKKEPQIPANLKETDFVWVAERDALVSMCKELKDCQEIAVDLEHHDFRSYQGFSCLVQISTRKTDYIIDALALRSELHHLNETFTNPKIVKVFHGADMDIQWLQRDFGVYVVNLFDTFHASHVLQMERHGFAYLLEHYCKVSTNKKYQLADWRIRPLTKEMLQYAQCDTHYLLYIFDLMRNELIDQETMGEVSALEDVLGRSALTSLKKYEKVLYDVESGEGNGGWKNVLKKCNIPLNDTNIAVLRAVHAWRDHIARKEDESTRFVMPNHMLINLARFMPITANDVISGCSPTPSTVRLYARELATIIEQAMESAKSITSVQKTSISDSRKKTSKEATVKVSSLQTKNTISTDFTLNSSFFGEMLHAHTVKNDLRDSILKSFVAETPSQVVHETVKVAEQEIPKAQPGEEKAVPAKRKDGADLLAEFKLSSKKQKLAKAPEIDPEFASFDYSKAKEEKDKKVEKKPKQFDPMKEFIEEEQKSVKKRNVKRKPKSMTYQQK